MRARSNLLIRFFSVAIVCLILSIYACSVTAAEESKVKSCSKCKNTGRIDSKLPADFRNLPFRSSAVIEHKSGCCGLGWLPCPRKKCPFREKALKEFEELTAPLKEWVRSRRSKVEAKAFAKHKKLKGIKALHAETKHYYVSGTFKSRIVKYKYKGMTKKKKYDAAHSLHLYAERVEKIHARVIKMLEHEGEYFPHFTDKWLLMIWEKKEQQEAASYEFCGFTNTAGAAMDAVHYTTWDAEDDPYLHHKIAYALTYLITDDYGGVVEYFPIWLKEAMAHWVEYDMFGELRIWGTGEDEFIPGCPARKLKSSIKKEVKRKSRNIVPLSEFMNDNIMKLSGWERLKGWSLVDWMRNGYGRKSQQKLLVDLKQNYPKSKQQVPSFKRVFGGMLPEDIDAAWEAWVLETYPNQEEDWEEQ